MTAGEVFTFHPDCQDAGRLFECLRVTPCSAVCRPLERTMRSVTNHRTGKTVEFSVPGATFTIAPTASVLLVRRS